MVSCKNVSCWSPCKAIARARKDSHCDSQVVTETARSFFAECVPRPGLSNQKNPITSIICVCFHLEGRLWMLEIRTRRPRHAAQIMILTLWPVDHQTQYFEVTNAPHTHACTNNKVWVQGVAWSPYDILGPRIFGKQILVNTLWKPIQVKSMYRLS